MSNEYLANRYGKTRARAKNQRLIWVTVGTALVVTFFAWSISINFATGASITGAVQNFDVTGPKQTKVTIQINNQSVKDGACSIKVLNKNFTVVGYKEVDVASALGKTATIETAVNTTDLGVSASVASCWLK
jgi:hypothetical protein